MSDQEKAEEKAKELIEKFKPYTEKVFYNTIVLDETKQIEHAKQCALICVEEMLADMEYKNFLSLSDYQSHLNFWEGVKTALTK